MALTLFRSRLTDSQFAGVPLVCVCVYMYVRVCVYVQARVLDLRVLSKSDIRIDILRHRFAHTLVLHVNA